MLVSHLVFVELVACFQSELSTQCHLVTFCTDWQDSGFKTHTMFPVGYVTDGRKIRLTTNPILIVGFSVQPSLWSTCPTWLRLVCKQMEHEFGFDFTGGLCSLNPKGKTCH